MIKISLNNLLFFAHHGLHEEEKILGADFEVNVDLFYNTPVAVIAELEQTIDYSVVYNLIRNRMKQPTPLLETFVMELGHQIKEAFPVINELNIRITKINPPITSFSGNVEVSYHERFN